MIIGYLPITYNSYNQSPNGICSVPLVIARAVLKLQIWQS